MNSNYDVIVVGGRVAGASTALLLARAGVRVALVERGRYGADTVSTHGLMRAGVLQLSRWGLIDHVIAAGTPAIHTTTFSYADGESTHVSIRPGVGVPALYAPRRYLLDRILVDAAAEAGADVRHGATVTALLRDNAGCVTGVRTTDQTGRSRDLRASITVGADGVRSTVAKQVGAPVLRAARHGSSILYRYYAGLSGQGYEWSWGSGAAAGILPTNDGLACLFVGTRPDDMRDLVRRDGTESAFRAVLQQADTQLAERADDATPVGQMRGWMGVPGYLRQSFGPGWALVGDAGYFKDPLSTHGITDALRDAELLADAVHESLAGAMSEYEALSAYQATRDRLSARLFESAEQLAGYDWTLPEVRGVLRQVSSAMSDELEHLYGLPERYVPLDIGSTANVAEAVGT